MIAVLHRNYGLKQTTGQLVLFEKDEIVFQCKTLEPEWNENKKGISCIPERTYQVKKHISPTYYKCLKVFDVAGRSEILIHWGNYRDNTEGCILVGTSFQDINKDGLMDVINSKAVFDKLMQVVKDSFRLIIIGDE